MTSGILDPKDAYASVDPSNPKHYFIYCGTGGKLVFSVRGDGLVELGDQLHFADDVCHHDLPHLYLLRGLVEEAIAGQEAKPE